MQQLEITWRPRDEVYSMLSQFGVTRQFAEDLIPEFVLYWNERGTSRHSWGSRFFKHAVAEWRKAQASTAVAEPVSAITYAWRPSHDAVNILLARGIPDVLISQEVATFVLYWRDRGDACNTWNSRFIAHVQHAVAAQRRLPQAQPRSLVEDLTDRSWAQDGGSNGKG